MLEAAKPFTQPGTQPQLARSDSTHIRGEGNHGKPLPEAEASSQAGSKTMDPTPYLVPASQVAVPQPG